MSFFKELGQKFGSQNTADMSKESSQLEGAIDAQTSNCSMRESYVKDFSSLPVMPIYCKCDISNVSWIKINKIVYEKETSFIDNLSTIYSALHETAQTVIMVIN